MKTHPLTRLLLFLLLLLVAHSVVSLAFPAQLPTEVLEFDRYLDEGVDVLYLGDSTLLLPVGGVTTGEILQELLPEQKIGQIAHPAYGLEVFYDYVTYMDRSGSWPQTLVLPINIRSFSPAWDMRPAYEFTTERRILGMGLPLARFLYRPLDVFGYFQPTVSQQVFLNTPVYDGDVVVGQVRDFETVAAGEVLGEGVENAYREVELEDEETAQAVLTYHYMFRLTPYHRKLNAMIAVAELAAERGVDVIFYITPVNTDQGERFLGAAFRERFADNVRVVQSRLEAASLDNAMLLNLAFGLPAYGLTDTEHLTETGKEYVAEQIAATVRGQEGYTASATPVATAVATSPAAPPLSADTGAASTATPAPTATTEVVVPPTATAEAVAQAAAGGDVTSVRYLQQYRPSGTYPVDMYRITFETVDEFDELVETQADLYIPYVESEMAFPVLGHAAGTTGVGNGCAPIDELATGRSWGSYHAHSLAYAAQGYIVVFPNWLHFEDPQRSHHYFVSDFQAHTLLDAVRAAYRLWDRDQELGTRAQPDQIAFMMGYSSGGHAVFAARDYAEAYAPELPLQGVIGFGAVTDPGLLLQEDPIFGPYIVYAYRDFYGEEIIDPAEVYLPAWTTDFEDDVLSTCVDEIFYYYSHSARRMYEPEFRELLYDGQLAAVHPAFAEQLDANAAGLGGGTDIPVLILQGTADTVITPPSQQAFMDELCALGSSVTWAEYQGVDHAGIRWSGFGSALGWMQNAVEGSEPRSDCPPLP